MMGELKPCPFCGDMPETEHMPEIGGYFVSCENGECSVNPSANNGGVDSEEAAIVAWNIRASDQQNEALLAQVNRLRDVMSMVHLSGGLGTYKHSCMNAVLAATKEQPLDSLKARIAEDVIEWCVDYFCESLGLSKNCDAVMGFKYGATERYKPTKEANNEK